MATTSKYTIAVNTTGADAASKKLGGVSNSLSSMAKKAALAGAAYFSAQGIISGMKKAVELAGEQEQAEKQLEKALGKNISSLKAYASAQQQVTTFGDEVTLRAAAQFAQFTKNESQIKQLLTATQDYAAAQGVDLVSAAQLVAKSFGSSTNALSRYGVEVTGAAGSTERLTSMTENMARMFGGQAAAAADTFAGKMQQTKNAIGDAQESLAFLLLPAIEDVIGAVKNASDFWNDFLSQFRTDPIDTEAEAFDRLNRAWSAFYKEWERTPQIGFFIDPTNPEVLTEAGRRLREMGLFEQANAMTTLAIAQNEYNAHVEKMREKLQPATDMMIQFSSEAWIMADEVVPALIESGDEWLDQMEQSVAAMDEYWASVNRANEADRMALVIQNEKLRIASSMAGSIASLNQTFKGSAEVTKRLAQAQAVIDTYAAANAAYKAVAGIPVVGPALGAAAAAAAIGAGLANVAQIEAQKFARGGDFTTSGPQLIMVGDNPGGRERVQITPTSSPNLEGPRGGGVTINFTGPVTDRDFVRDVIVPQVRKAARYA